MDVKRVKGTRDIFPEEAQKWQFVEDAIRKVMYLYNYQEIRTPIFEHTELFQKGTGEDTDVVQKQMYSFKDLKGRSLTLRPEGTPPVIRAYLESGMENKGGVAKLFYIGPMFRYERPQKGRMRQFHQYGVEAIGSGFPELDAEVISLSLDIFNALGLKNVETKLNSIGCDKCRGKYKEALKSYLKPRLNELCDDCQRRYNTNPLRILDCKKDREKLEDAPAPYDYLCEDCHLHFEKVKEILTKTGIKYKLDKYLVRGLDYYTRTVFEFVHSYLGAQDALGGGGRYDGLIAQLGGKPKPAVGVAIGIERVMMVMEKMAVFPDKKESPLVYLVIINEELRNYAFETMTKLRNIGIRCEMDFLRRSIKAQMREANRISADYVLFIGKDEIEKGKFKIKDMKTGNEIMLRQEMDAIKEIIDVKNT